MSLTWSMRAPPLLTGGDRGMSPSYTSNRPCFCGQRQGRFMLCSATCMDHVKAGRASPAAEGMGASTFFMLTPAARPGRSLPGVVLCEEDLVRLGWLPAALGSADVRSRRGSPITFALDVLLTPLLPNSEVCDPGTGVPGLLTGEMVPDPGSANLDGTPFGSAGWGTQAVSQVQCSLGGGGLRQPEMDEYRQGMVSASNFPRSPGAHLSTLAQWPGRFRPQRMRYS